MATNALICDFSMPFVSFLTQLHQMPLFSLSIGVGRYIQLLTINDDKVSSQFGGFSKYSIREHFVLQVPEKNQFFKIKR